MRWTQFLCLHNHKKCLLIQCEAFGSRIHILSKNTSSFCILFFFPLQKSHFCKGSTFSGTFRKISDFAKWSCFLSNNTEVCATIYFPSCYTRPITWQGLFFPLLYRKILLMSPTSYMPTSGDKISLQLYPLLEISMLRLLNGNYF